MNKRLLSLSLIFCLALSCHSQDVKGEDACAQYIARLIRSAKSYIGCPYEWAATGPDRFDCSGFVYYIFSHAGVHLPRNSRQLSRSGKRVTLRNIRRGDLVFFLSGEPPHRDISHVGIVITDYKDGDFQFIHANLGQGCVSINHFRETRFQRTYGGARRVIDCR